MLSSAWRSILSIFLYCNGILICNGQCDSAYQCYGTSRTNPSIDCAGYHSCDSASWTQLSTYSSDCSCSGSYSCYQGLSFYNFGDYYCAGLFSCAYMTYLYSSDGTDVECYGEKSCVESLIYGYDIYCYGFDSCVGSRIYLRGTLFIYSPMAAKDSLIYSDSNSVNLYFYGGYTGYDTTVVCDNGDICNIYCFDNGCNDLSLASVGGVFNITCEIGSYNSSICPNETSYALTENSLIKNAEFEWLDVINLYSSFNTPTQEAQFVDTICQNTNTINCDDYNDDECQSTFTNYNGSICCSGKFSCDYISIITHNNISSNNNNNIYNSSHRCDGAASCAYSTLKAINGGNIHSTAHQGAIYSTIKGTNESNIFCNSYQACYESKISNGKNLYCLGYQACFQSNITGMNGNAYCNSYRACDGVSLVNVIGNIYAIGQQALRSGSITNVGSSVSGYDFKVKKNCLK